MLSLPLRHRELLRVSVPLAFFTGLALLSGCSGGGAGDSDIGGDFTTSVVEPFVGVWALNGELNGLPEDEALLVIRSADEQGRYRTAVYELDGSRNCYFPPSSTGGRAAPDPAFREGVFLNNVASFPNAVLSRAGNAMIITYLDEFDVDGDGNTTERPSFSAPSVGITEIDIENQLCSR